MEHVRYVFFTNISFSFFPYQNLTVQCDALIYRPSTPATNIEPHIGRLTQGGSYSGQFIHGAGGRKAIAWCVTLTCSGVRQLETPTCEYVCGKASFTVCFWTWKPCVYVLWAQSVHLQKAASVIRLLDLSIFKQQPFFEIELLFFFPIIIGR